MSSNRGFLCPPRPSSGEPDGGFRRYTTLISGALLTVGLVAVLSGTALPAQPAPPPNPEAPAPVPGSPPAAPSPADPAEVQQGYRKALAQYQKGEYNPSLETIRSVFNSAPESYELRMLAAANYMQLGSYPNAAAHLRTCMKQHPGRPEPVAMLGSVYRAMKQPGAAVNFLINGIVAHKGDSRLRMELAQVYYSLGNFVPARQQLERILQSNSNYFDALYLDGMIFLREGKYENAEIRLNQALAQKPRNKQVLASLYNNLGMALERNGDAYLPTEKSRASYYYENAEKNYGFALKVDPDHPTAAANRDRIRQKRATP